MGWESCSDCRKETVPDGTNAKYESAADALGEIDWGGGGGKHIIFYILTIYPYVITQC